jgi:hypothetical protein
MKAGKVGASRHLSKPRRRPKASKPERLFTMRELIDLSIPELIARIPRSSGARAREEREWEKLRKKWPRLVVAAFHAHRQCDYIPGSQG